jgi:hypothetical protein
MKQSDVHRVAYLHSEAMGESLWAQLGERFLRNLYRGLLKTPQFVGFVYEDATQIEGFIAGSTETKAMMRRALLSNLPRLTLSGILGLRSWSVAQKLLETSNYFRNSSEELRIDIPAESLFCSFTVATRGKRISGHINKVLFDTLCAMGHPAVKITTEANNEGANRQLLSWGFESQGRFVFYGKEMLCYTLLFSNSDRVSARDWRTNPWTKEGE